MMFAQNQTAIQRERFFKLVLAFMSWLCILVLWLYWPHLTSTIKNMKTLQIFHHSKYTCRPLGGDLPSLDLMIANVRDFLKDCEDVLFADTLIVSVDIKEVDNLVVQIFDNQLDDTDLSLYIELNESTTSTLKFPSFATIHVHQPLQHEVNQVKLDKVKESAEMIREGFSKLKSSQIEAGLKAIEEIVS